MHIVAHLTAPLYSDLMQTVRHPRDQVRKVSDHAMLLRTVQTRIVDLIVDDTLVAVAHDPAALHDGTLALLRVRRECPKIPFIIITPPASCVAELLPRFGGTDGSLTIPCFHPIETGRPRFLEIVKSMATTVASHTLLLALQPYIDRMPLRTGGIISEVVLHPERFVDVGSIGITATIPRRTLDRHVKHSGLKSTRTLLTIARLSRAYYGLQTDTVKAVAQKLGYSDARSLRSDIISYFGVQPDQLSQYTPAAFLQRLIERVVQLPEAEDASYPKPTAVAL